MVKVSKLLISTVLLLSFLLSCTPQSELDVDGLTGKKSGGQASFSYPTINAIYTLGSPITANVPDTGSLNVITYGADKALPAGLFLNASTGVISGTPTSPQTSEVYTISAITKRGTFSTTLSMAVVAGAPSAVSLSSDYTDSTLAGPGSVLTLDFSIGGSPSNIVVTFQGQNASVSDLGGGNFRATYTLAGTETQGAVNFTLDYDFFGNPQAQVSATTDASSVTIDFTPPATPTLARNTPAVNYGSDATPSFDIGNLTSGDTVGLFTDSSCSTQVATTTVSSTTETLETSSALTVERFGSYYARATDPLGNSTACVGPLHYAYTLNEPFISTWSTTAPAETITLPLHIGFTYDFYIDWGDGSDIDHITAFDDAAIIHAFATAGTQTLTVIGTMQRFAFADTGDKDKLLTIPHLGAVGWTSMEEAFFGATNLTTVNGGDLSNVTTMASMFLNATNARPDTSTWNTSNVTDMSRMFRRASQARPDTASWNMSNVTTILRMFDRASNAHHGNVDTSSWNTANITDMGNVFEQTSLDADVSGWDTSNVTNMYGMFLNAPSANPDVSSWNTSNVTSMMRLFNNAPIANPNVLNWDTSNVSSFREMFRGATVANPDMRNWNFSSASNIILMFSGTNSLSDLNYSNLLVAIENTHTVDGLTLDANCPQRNAIGDASYTDLTTNHGWTINDCGVGDTTAPSDPIIAMATPSDTWSTTDSTPEFALSGLEDGGEYRLYTDASCSTLVSSIGSISGTTATAVVTTAQAIESIQNYYVIATDASGNESNCTKTPAFVYSANEPFVSTWNIASDGETLTFPLRAGEAYNFTIDWGDGNQEVVTTDTLSHVYANSGTYTVTIIGSMPAFYINANAAMSTKLLTVPNLGDVGWTNLARAFRGATNLTTVNRGVVDSVTDMSWMFEGAVNATPDTSGWNTANVTNIAHIFRNAQSNNADVSGWNTSNVTNMDWVFYNNRTYNPDVSGWDTANVTSFYAMFFEARTATPDTSGWNTSNVVNLNDMFRNAFAATPDTSGWDTSNVTSMARTFYDARNANPDVSSWNVSNVVSIENIFFNADMATPNTSTWNTANMTNLRSAFVNTALADPDVSGWNVSNVTNMINTFNNADGATPDVSSWNTANVVSMEGLFTATNLANPDVSSWNVSNVTSMRNLFNGCASCIPNVSSWDVANVTNMQGIFAEISSSADPDVSLWNVSNVTNLASAFFDADGADPDVSGWDVSNVTDMDSLFSFTALANPDVSSWNTANVTSMSGTFKLALNATPNVASWNTSNVTNMYEMFRGAAVAAPNVASWDTSNVENFSFMWTDYSNANPDLSSWDVSSATNINGMFYQCTTCNPNVTSWNTANLTTMDDTFRGMSSFNPDVSSWNTSNLTSMRRAFNGASGINPDLSTWDFSNVTDMVNAFDSSGMSTANYDNAIIQMNATSSQAGVSVGAVGVNNTTAISGAAKSNLESNGWVFDDAGGI